MPRRQCPKCPWRTDVNPHDIPNGYCETRHRGLRSTIADLPEAGGFGNLLSGVLNIMACHESRGGHEQPCVGWLDNQIGSGNNIALRLAVMRGQVDGKYELVGEQHARFEDTLPR